MAVSNNGELACTVSDDKSAKIFDIVNFGKWFSGVSERSISFLWTQSVQKKI